MHRRARVSHGVTARACHMLASPLARASLLLGGVLLSHGMWRALLVSRVHAGPGRFSYTCSGGRSAGQRRFRETCGHCWCGIRIL